MKRILSAVALAAAVATGLQFAYPIATPAMAQADPFDSARYYIGIKQNEKALELIDSGAFTIDQGNYEGWTMLHYAAEAGNLEMVKALLERGADPTLKTKYGSLPYEVAGSTMVKAAIASAVEAKTGINPMAPAKPAFSPRPAAAASTSASASATKSPREKLCEQRWYSSQALCSDSTCKMREYRKWQTCLKTGSYY
ncbi:ankyrin repeat domain-containing protein [Tsuneonella sp. HG249]